MMISMEHEWERIALLGSCVQSSRKGKPVNDKLKKRLSKVHQKVLKGRSESPWCFLVRDFALSSHDQDVLICALAPDVEPRIGWMFHELQSGTSPYPTPALVQELLFLNGAEARAAQKSFAENAPLFKVGLLQNIGVAMYQPIRPTALARERLVGKEIGPSPIAPTGTIEIPVRGKWDELILPDSCLQLINEYLYWIIHREKVVTQWEARVPGGPVGLFVGPSGTGKSFAAEVIASKLGWRLYRVDLGIIVSKYIGETEKNLNSLFESAAGQKMILLFDEADSLFGKRGEVRDARDRYANMEISHLLSRIELHEGPCLLTSNFRDNIDPAFARRFQIVIDFPRPCSKDRGRLWKIHFPPKAPRSKQIDPVALGKAVELTGGQIRNAAVHAAFLAAGESMPITMTHIASAVWTELAKDGGEIILSTLGFLADHLKKEIT